MKAHLMGITTSYLCILIFILVTTQVILSPPVNPWTIRDSGSINEGPREPLESDYFICLGGIGYNLENGTTRQVYASAQKASTVFKWAIGNLSNGGTVEFDVGQYNFSTYVDVTHSGVNIVGQGRDSVIFAEDNMNTWILEVISERDIYFYNFRIEGNKENQDIPDGASNKGCGIYVRDCANVTIEKVEANNCWARGINIYSSSDVLVVDNIARDNGVLELGNIRYDSYAIHRSNNVHVVNNVGIDPWMDNIVIYGCSDVLVSDNTVSGTRQGSGSGVVLDGDSLDQTFRVTVRDNIISDQGWGITGYNYQDVVIENNSISIIRRDGVALHYHEAEHIIDVVDVTVVNNIIQYVKRNGIHVDSHNRNHIIMNNTISNVEEAAIRVGDSYGGADNVKIWNNTINDSCIQPFGTDGEGAIYLRSPSSQIDIQSNRVVNTRYSKPSINIGAGSQEITVMYNHLTDPITNNAGSEATISYNWKVGFETFPSGQTSYSLPHGFSGGTPVDVEVIWMSNIGSRTWIWTADSTYVTVTLSSASSGSYDFEWNARNWD